MLMNSIETADFYFSAWIEYFDLMIQVVVFILHPCEEFGKHVSCKFKSVND